ncbi:DUF4231 domain-containing protein [Nonomuraea sp. NPDC047529]|uniref:DUF4231 domain-containing protein n=1 Tax=Nonomuraea sp. NPDC047529 TaxID=3155623 RepID=UPI0033E9960F
MSTPSSNSTTYAIEIANSSYSWYQRAAIKARRFYRASEAIQLVLSAAIPIIGILVPGDATAPAILGAILVVLTGMKSIFHWHDDYLRFSAAREAVEAERRLYFTNGEPYSQPSTKDSLLASAITRIEREEMSSWMKIATRRPGPDRSSKSS